VIFTGSQLPIGDLRTDAKENLITSIEIAASRDKGEPIIKEVGLYFEYKLYRANRTTKVNAEQFEAFTSFNYPPLAESGVHLQFNKQLLFKPDEKARLIVRKNLVADIVVLKLFPGITKKTVECILNTPDVKAIVLESYGAGNAPTFDWFIDLLQKTIQKGVYIINVTQCLGGAVMLGHYETSVQLKEIGVVNGKDITLEAAVAKTMYLLGAKEAKNNFKHYFEKPLRGELSIS